jgi:hypothetical protein
MGRDQAPDCLLGQFDERDPPPLLFRTPLSELLQGVEQGWVDSGVQQTLGTWHAIPTERVAVASSPRNVTCCRAFSMGPRPAGVRGTSSLPSPERPAARNGEGVRSGLAWPE